VQACTNNTVYLHSQSHISANPACIVPNFPNLFFFSQPIFSLTQIQEKNKEKTTFFFIIFLLESQAQNSFFVENLKILPPTHFRKSTSFFKDLVFILIEVNFLQNFLSPLLVSAERYHSTMLNNPWLFLLCKL